MPRTGSLYQWLLRPAKTATLGAGARRCGIERTDRCDSSTLTRHLWDPAHPCRTPGARYPRGAQAGRATDVRRRATRRQPPQMDDYHRAGSCRAGSAGSGRTQLRGGGAESFVGRRHHVYPDLGGVSVPRRGARCVQPAHRRLGDGDLSAHRVGTHGTQHGARAAPARRRDSSFGPG